MKERSTSFNEYELGAIDIVVTSEIYKCKEKLKDNNFVYKSDKVACELFLEKLESVHNKINVKTSKKELLENEKSNK